MTRNFTCIVCPNGCDMTAQIENGALIDLRGNLCERGRVYAQQEVSHPVRNIATSVAVDGGEMPLCSVRLTQPIPKDRIFDVVREITRHRLIAPVFIGDVVIRDVLGLGSDVIATRNVEKI